MRCLCESNILKMTLSVFSFDELGLFIKKLFLRCWRINLHKKNYLFLLLLKSELFLILNLTLNKRKFIFLTEFNKLLIFILAALSREDGPKINLEQVVISIFKIFFVYFYALVPARFLLNLVQCCSQLRWSLGYIMRSLFVLRALIELMP
jgi:hypothetical protein